MCSTQEPSGCLATERSRQPEDPVENSTVIKPEGIRPAGGQGGPAQQRPRWLRRLWAVHLYNDTQQGRGQAPRSWPGRRPPC